jgi:Alr-MurF fusion protein
MKYSIGHIAEIMQGEFLQFREDNLVEHLLLDSRRLIFPDTSLFFSLQGPSRDGSQFLEELYTRGVRNFVVQGAGSAGPGSADRVLGGTASSEIAWAGPGSVDTASIDCASGESASADPGRLSTLRTSFPDANIILVGDTLAALQQLAAYHRRQFAIPVIAITGSNGKTIVKEWLNQLLEDVYHIVRSPKSYNSRIGVPLSVWQLNESHELAIFEAGISRRGEMRRLEAILKPTIGIFTNIGEPHSEGFRDLAEKAAEKLQLFDGAGALIYCKDQPETEKALAVWLHSRDQHASARPDQAGPARGPAGQAGPASGTHPLELFSWGRAEASTLQIHALVKTGGATTITTGYDGRAFVFTIPFTDDASIENILHCVCALLYFGQSEDVIRSKLQGLSPIAMRLELKRGINHCSIINDSYSADLSSLQIALDFLSQQQQHARRTVILSDILESGREPGQLYEEIALALRQKGVNRLVGIGGQIGGHREVFRRVFPGEAVFYPSVDHFKKDFHQLHFRDETILIKGARIFEFEEIDRLLSEQIHQTVLEINLGAMAHNLREYRQLLEPGTRVMAMVKAFAYGSGSFEIANLLQFHRVDYLGVAYADEGVALRRGGIGTPVMVMNTEDSSFDSLVEYNLEPVIYSFPLLYSFDKWLKKEGILQFPVHIELETGMNRLGFPLQQVSELASVLKNTAFKVQSVFSHLAASEETQQDAFTMEQAALYTTASAVLQEALTYPFLRHIANSAAIVRYPALRMDMVRLGIGLYGIDSAVSHLLDLQEVSTLKSTIAQIKDLKDGDTISYNRRGIAFRGMKIATVRIGYADGYPRRLGNGAGKMWVKGHLAPVTGNVCMDMTMIDITGIPDVREGDEVVVFGNELPVSQLASWAQTIPYEILTGVSQRVRRVYFEG